MDDADQFQDSESGLQQPLMLTGATPASVFGRQVHRENGSVDDGAPVCLPKGSEYAKSIVYGGLDAIVTSFALVASISGGNLSADGISMGLSDVVSSSTERDLAFSSRRETIWRMVKDPHSQILDLVGTYKAHGMTEEDAIMVVECFSKYKQLLMDQKMTMEQGLVTSDPSESLWKNGCVTFACFVEFGCTPLLAYVVLNPFTENNQLKFGAACIVTAASLIVLGLAKAKISSQKYVSSVLMVLLNGASVATVAYFIGWLLTDVLGIQD